MPKLSDFQIPATPSGGRKARPYKSFFSRRVGAGFIPARTGRTAAPAFSFESLNLGHGYSAFRLAFI
jgi:hypothetical protein